MEYKWEEMTDLQRKGKYDHIHHKAQELEGRSTKTMITFGIKDDQGNIVTGHRRALRI